MQQIVKLVVKAIVFFALQSGGQCRCGNNQYSTSFQKSSEKNSDCQVKCKGYVYFSIQSDGQCWCGNQFPRNSKYNQIDNNLCGGIDGLGGSFTNNIFRSSDYVIKKSQKIGCYFHNQFNYFAGDVTVLSDCQDECLAGNFKFFSLFQGIKCYCGNTISISAKDDILNYAACAKRYTFYYALSQFTSSQYIGCYIDDILGDIAPNPTEFTIKSPAGCQHACKGFNYFALQDRKCYCGDRYATQTRYYKVADSECGVNLKTGNLGLGKPSRNAIYRHIEFNGLANIDVKTLAPSIPMSQYIGCYKDDSSRDLKKSVGLVSQIGECQSKCTGYIYFAVQGRSCFCGNAYGTTSRYSKIANSKCKVTISGTTLLWGNDKNLISAIYRHRDYIISPVADSAATIMSVNISQYLGCYKDDNYRDIAPTSSPVKDLVSCQTICQDYNFFAVQNGTQCSCGSKYSTQVRYEKLADNECGTNIANSTLGMGGLSKNAVYRNILYKGPANIPVTTIAPTFPYPSSQFLGCFIDDDEHDLKKYVGDVYELSDCQNKCAGYVYFALQNGRQCYCGNAYSTSSKYSQVSNNECESISRLKFNKVKPKVKTISFGSKNRNAV